MTTRMLIDARHPEETRVAVVKGNRIEEFDFESQEHKQLKGNIYLAKVTRVEPSLQAAFIDYGGNRHGFLAFSEIHPDYYQIPKEDREALLREEAEHAAEEEALRAAEDEDDTDEDAVDRFDDEGGREPDVELEAEGREDEADAGDEPAPRRRPQSAGRQDDHAVDSLRQKRMNLRRRYKIQDVIRRRQVLLVQVVKEERGNKGAALTTYMSLAGRYCVLMPNTSHGGGISRKISNASDRKRLKSIIAEMDLPKTMGCIVRTAGLQRTRTEIKRDFDYLARLWDEIRERTLHSSAPAEIYGDSDLVKRAIRDIYNRDIDEVLVEGEEGYRAARSFMKLLMPSHAKKVVPYADATPLFQRYGAEDQLAAMYQPVVQLKSGGYIVINPTEALVSIDINSGRNNREHNIEQTATATNLEAAAEIARQLRLRDMAGLIVIDFIDMENGSNVRKVEKAMKEALKDDRARIQVGRISGFGLFEMSRQRLRTGMLEASTRVCHHCEGTGFIRTASSSGLAALRMLEDEAARGRGSRLLLRGSQEAALYVLNRKRAELAEIEERYGVVIEVLSDGTQDGARMVVESGGPPPSHAPRLPQPTIEPEEDDFVDAVDEEEEDEAFAGEDEPRRERERERDAEGEDGRGGRRRRRRRRRGGGRGEEPQGGDAEATVEDEGEADLVEAAERPETAHEDEERTGEDEPRRRRGRRGRRGGRRREGRDDRSPVEAGPADDSATDEALPEPEPLVATAIDEEQAEPAGVAPAAAEDEVIDAERPRGRRRPRARKADAVAADSSSVAPEIVAAVADEAEIEAPKPRRGRRKAAVAETEPAPETGSVDASPADSAPAKPRRGRRKAAESLSPADVPTDARPATQPETPTGPEQDPVAAEPFAAEPSSGDADAAAQDAPRRGWWQRTFGA